MYNATHMPIYGIYVTLRFSVILSNVKQKKYPGVS